MGIFDIFSRKGAVAGGVSLIGLPPHKMYSVSVTFFPVASASSEPPFAADPPVAEWRDTESVKEAEEPDDKPLRFKCQRPAGHYYLGVGVIAYMERGGKLFAQVERFFPMKQPHHIQPGLEGNITLSATWPVVPFESLSHYGTVHPEKSQG
jgi:hypothetical protein